MFSCARQHHQCWQVASVLNVLSCIQDVVCCCDFLEQRVDVGLNLLLLLVALRSNGN